MVLTYSRGTAEHEALKKSYSDLLSQIEAARARVTEPRPITLIAVSKFQPVEAVEALYHMGHRDFGENYVQELVKKAQYLSLKGCDEIRWHFIGTLQSNKVKALVPWISAIHSVDSLKLAQMLNRCWEESKCNGKLKVFIQVNLVNLTNEKSRGGCDPNEAKALVESMSQLSCLNLCGLMTLPTPEQDPAHVFQALKDLSSQLGHKNLLLSIGMSQDLETAIQAGTSYLRIGTALFGQRSG